MSIKEPPVRPSMSPPVSAHSLPASMVDYRQVFRRGLTAPEFRHLLLLLYWPIHGLLFLFLERFYTPDAYHVMHCAADDFIPFCEWFVIPYLLWFIFLIGIHIYTLLYEVDVFKRMMVFIIITYFTTTVIYFLFPTCQELRPTTFSRDNLFTRFMAWFYEFDTNTNVCPSIHVIGSLAAMFAAWDCRRFQAVGWKVAYGLLSLSICLSTVFLKQHSLLDVLAAFPLCLVAYIVAFRIHRKPVEK